MTLRPPSKRARTLVHLHQPRAPVLLRRRAPPPRLRAKRRPRE